MNSVASSIRRANLAAARLHTKLRIKNKISKMNGRVDIFDVVSRLDIPLMFKPLDGLLGAYLVDPAPGMVVTTKRPLSVQRFTAAHELGHHVLQHLSSLDDEDVIHRHVDSFVTDKSLQELEANAFAAAFLLPQWLIAWHCKRQGWVKETLKRPDIVYQLALRTGLSFQATCWTLQREKFISGSDARVIAGTELKTIKKILLGDLTPPNYYGDVWILTERDTDGLIEGGPSDIFVVRLLEHSGSGYLWDIEELGRNGFKIFQDDRSSASQTEVIGGFTTRSVVTSPPERSSGKITLVESRPWSPSEPLGVFSLQYDIAGAELEGISRAEKRYQFSAVQ